MVGSGGRWWMIIIQPHISRHYQHTLLAMQCIVMCACLGGVHVGCQCVAGCNTARRPSMDALFVDLGHSYRRMLC